jgi:hypothetical protein
VTGTDDERQVDEAILAYLAEHPEAMDTPEGIAEWWLMRHQVRTGVSVIVRALRRLTDSGVLEELGGGDVRRYRLRRALPDEPPGEDVT